MVRFVIGYFLVIKLIGSIRYYRRDIGKTFTPLELNRLDDVITRNLCNAPSGIILESMACRALT